MGLISELRTRARHVVGPVVAVCFTGYFAYHAVNGDRGITAWFALKQQVTDTQAVHDKLVAERRRLEHRVGLLKPESLDPDMLEERVRHMLNYGRADDVVILLDPGLAAN